jgi:excinuclease UvrABC ATPase subunit
VVGTPETIAKAENSYTGQWLARILSPNGNRQSHDHS